MSTLIYIYIFLYLYTCPYAVVNIIDEQEKDYSVVVGSSMGGAIAIEAARRGIVTTPILLLAPAIKKILTLGATESRAAEIMTQWYAAFNGAAEGTASRRILVVHGASDGTVPIEHSVELCKAIGAQLIEVPGKVVCRQLGLDECMCCAISRM
jgi:pimeloyl-ACP methyl ester carboxylesterase